MNAMMILSDAAQVVNGKLYILGGGWTIIPPIPMPMAIAVRVSVDPSEFDVEHDWRIYLEDADGHAVIGGSPEAPFPIQAEGKFMASQSPLAPPGTPNDVAISVAFTPITLAPNSRFMWRLTIDGDTPPGGFSAFTTTSVPQ
jgi:hypothetical protein